MRFNGTDFNKRLTRQRLALRRVGLISIPPQDEIQSCQKLRKQAARNLPHAFRQAKFVHRQDERHLRHRIPVEA